MYVLFQILISEWSSVLKDSYFCRKFVTILTGLITVPKISLAGFYEECILIIPKSTGNLQINKCALCWQHTHLYMHVGSKYMFHYLLLYQPLGELRSHAVIQRNYHNFIKTAGNFIWMKLNTVNAVNFAGLIFRVWRNKNIFAGR